MKRTISLLLTIAMLLSMTAIFVQAADSEEEAMNEIQVFNGGQSLSCLAVNGAVQQFNYDVLFGEVWGREDKLSFRDRSLITVVVMAQGLTDTSFQHHLMNARKNGITRDEIAEILTHAAFYAGWPKAWAAFRMAKEIWTEAEAAKDAKAAHQQEMVFPIGAPNDGFAQYFSGKSYLAPISTQ